MFIGSYEQDNNAKNGREPIEWIVLEKQGSKLLVISKYGLDCAAYSVVRENVTWETCSLREWLNGTFLNKAFDAAERRGILETKVANPDNSEHGTDGGRATTDRIFLLSAGEAEKYFPEQRDRRCAATKYAYKQGVRRGSNDRCWWWLRTPGSDGQSAAYVLEDGKVNYSGYLVDANTRAVRPAMWIDAG